MVRRLEGKVAIVTGGSSGFGLGIVKKFVEEGAKVLILDLNAEGGQKAIEANPGAKFIQGDVSRRADWEKALEKVLAEFGKLDIVVNNAGILIVKVCASCLVLLSFTNAKKTADDGVHRRRI
jgi:NAD(P)-dependent dehydrogenase (short-subunit alcohol dehydrogenase family)